MSSFRARVKGKLSVAARGFARIADFIKPWVAVVALIVGVAGFGYTGWTNHQQYVRLQDTFCDVTGTTGDISTADLALTTPGGQGLGRKVTDVAVANAKAHQKLHCPPTVTTTTTSQR